MANWIMSLPMSRKSRLATSLKSQVSNDANSRLATSNSRPSKSAGKARLGLLVTLLVLLAATGTAVIERNNLYDWWQLRHYQAPSVVAGLAAQDTMTAYARKLFYINHPAVVTGSAFSQPCPNDGGEKTIVLGCYHGGESGIYLLGVSDPRLNGVEQVTAAHEMLHAAYERLNQSERQRVDGLLLDYYDHDLHDQRIAATIAAYKQSEPHDVVDEMHSVFGTEIANLPAALENYYSQYFVNRATVAGFAAQYQGEFTSRQSTVAQDDARLTGMRSQINGLEADLKTRLSAINAQQTTLNAERANGNIPAYNAGVPGYNSLVDAYNSEAANLQALIAQYNQLVASRNAVALEEDQLSKELTSTAAPIK